MAVSRGDFLVITLSWLLFLSAGSDGKDQAVLVGGLGFASDSAAG